MDKAQLLATAEPAWAAYAQFAEQLQGAAEVNVTISGEPVSHRQVTFNQRGTDRLIYTRDLLGRTGGELLQASNSDYFFRLERPLGAPTWKKHKIECDEGTRCNPFTAHHIACRPLYVLSQRVGEILASPSFRLDGFEEFTEDDVPLVRLTYRHTPAHEGGIGLGGGWVVLRPKHYWTVHRYEVAVRYSDGFGMAVADFHYHDATAEFPILAHIDRLTPSSSMEGAWENRERCAYHFSSTDPPPPPEEFRISHYGFPEPPLGG